MVARRYKSNTWVAAIWIACISIAIYGIWISFPWLHQWAPDNSSALASWVQAIGGLAAIHFAGRYVAKQIVHSELQQRQVQRETDKASVWACIYAVRDVCEALYDLKEKLGGKSNRPPSSCTERIEGLEETIRLLLVSKPHPAAAASLLAVLAELAYSRVAIREYRQSTDREMRMQSAQTRLNEVRDALNNLRDLYRALDSQPI